LLPWQVIVLEDYADPFDAKQAGGGQPGQEKVAENDGYMEPYEAQKMMAVSRGATWTVPGPLPLAPRPPGSSQQELEATCEAGHMGTWHPQPWLPHTASCPPPRGAGTAPSPLTRSLCCLRPVEIKVIKDLPWPPPVGQLDGGASPPDSEAPAQPSQPQHNHEDTSGLTWGTNRACLGPGRWGPSRLPSPCCEAGLPPSILPGAKLQPDAPCPGSTPEPASLSPDSWYHGAISRTDAETLLRLCKEASYLVRNSETSKNDFSLSLKSSQGFMHMKLSRTPENKYVLGQNSPLFDSVPRIIHHYASHKLPIKGAEHMSLLYPVAIRTL
uniref:Src homology 2 domain containing F n=1 Tax=Pelodiscus sinensis TaxID=13735 RepID=K7GJQ4_PELSI